MTTKTFREISEAASAQIAGGFQPASDALTALHLLAQLALLLSDIHDAKPESGRTTPEPQ